jgi:hypothetical protein
MTTERRFFADDATRARADLRVNGNPDTSHDQESEVVLLGGSTLTVSSDGMRIHRIG